MVLGWLDEAQGAGARLAPACRGEGALSTESIADGHAVDEFHDQICACVRELTEVEDLNDAWVPDGRRGLCLAFEASNQFRVFGLARVEDFCRDLAVEGALGPAVYVAHGPAPEQRPHLVASIEHRAGERVCLRGIPHLAGMMRQR